VVEKFQAEDRRSSIEDGKMEDRKSRMEDGRGINYN